MLIVIGIDPGLGGAAALLNGHGVLEVVDLPVMVKPNGRGKVNAALFNLLLSEWSTAFGFAAESVLAVVESVSAMPRQGVSSVFSFGHSLGVIEGVLAARGIAIEHVTPQAWKRHYNLTRDKNLARTKATELYPASAAQFARVKDHGRAEAVLIARYGREHFA